MRIIITGSYNGQDSLGDECLMKAVVERVRYQQPDALIELQLHGVERPFVQEYARFNRLDVKKGLQSVLWRISHVLSRLYIPHAIAEMAANRGIGLAYKMGLLGAYDVIKRLRHADALFIYGGTQFSGQWFRLNAPAYLRSAEIVSRAGGKVFFGPQQYGPLSNENAETLRAALGNIVSDWRTRNPLDTNLLEIHPGQREIREVYDEVFSATRLYPSLTAKSAQHILVNLRAMSFDDDSTFDKEAYRGFAQLADRLASHYDLPIIFFGVSNESFCDDDAAFAAIRSMSIYPDRLSSVGRVRDEFRFFELAQEARLTISMSFHGCLLSAIAGAPFIPVTEGNYYDYKYEGFDKYTGGQKTPLVSLSGCDPETDFERIRDFAETFDASIVREVRARASEITDAFYSNAITQCATRA